MMNDNVSISCADADLPDGQIKSPSGKIKVQPLDEKYSDFPKPQINSITLASRSTGGAARDRHGRGTGCDGRGRAFDEWRVMRTAKSCGPDASTLAFKSVEAISLMTVTKEPDHRGDHEGNR
jgi:hypothetical protein